MKYKLNDSLVERLLNRLGLDPEDKTTYFLVRCPSCDMKEAFIYKGDDVIICNRRNKCGYSISIHKLAKEAIKGREIFESIVKEYSGDKTIDIIEKTDKIIIPKNITFFSDKIGTMGIKAYKYLKSRIPESNIMELGYIYDPDSEFHNTIFIPFYEDGKLVFFFARDFSGSDNAIRYRAPEDVNPKHYVYNIDKMEEGGTVFIFEGLFDALSLKTQIGTAMLSADLGSDQAIKIINKMPKNVIFVPDNDKAGDKTLEKNIKKFTKYIPPSLDINIYVYKIEGVKDFNDTGLDMIELSNCIEWNKNPFSRIKWQRKTF